MKKLKKNVFQEQKEKNKLKKKHSSNTLLSSLILMWNPDFSSSKVNILRWLQYSIFSDIFRYFSIFSWYFRYFFAKPKIKIISIIEINIPVPSKLRSNRPLMRNLMSHLFFCSKKLMIKFSFDRHTYRGVFRPAQFKESHGQPQSPTGPPTLRPPRLSCRRPSDGGG